MPSGTMTTCSQCVQASRVHEHSNPEQHALTKGHAYWVALAVCGGYVVCQAESTRCLVTSDVRWKHQPLVVSVNHDLAQSGSVQAVFALAYPKLRPAIFRPNQQGLLRGSHHGLALEARIAFPPKEDPICGKPDSNGAGRLTSVNYCSPSCHSSCKAIPTFAAVQLAVLPRPRPSLQWFVG